MDFEIGAVGRGDLNDLLDMILELARFAKRAQGVNTNIAVLEESLFGPDPAARALIARLSGMAAGYAVYFYTYSSFAGRRGIWLDDLYVRPEYRGCGLGQKLVQHIAAEGAAKHCSRFECSTLNWNERALEFYRGLGAQELSERVMLRLDEPGLRELARKRS